MFIWTFYLLSWNKCIMVNTKILSSTTVFSIDNNKKCLLSSKLKKKIIEGSCDTEDWSNG